METNRPGHTPTSDDTITYDAETALADAARTRLAIAEKARFRPVDHAVIIGMGASFIVSGLSFLAGEPIFPRYLLVLFPLVFVSVAAFLSIRRMNREGAVSRLDSLGRPGARIPLVLMLLSVVVYIASMPIRDIYGLSPWIEPAAAVVLTILWALASFGAARNNEREIEKARRELAALQAS